MNGVKEDKSKVQRFTGRISKEIFFWKKIIKSLASIKLAVFVILAMASVAAWGTIVESLYNDAKRAQETVYHSWYSYSVFLLLSINLTAVIVDRWPWRKKHIGFLSAHTGIIILMLGALMTRYRGIDGSMALKPGESKNRITVGLTDLVAYSGLITGEMRKIYEREVHFLKNPPSKDRPHIINLGGDEIVIDDFRPYSIPREKIERSDKKEQGPGVRFQISNHKVSQSGWLLLGPSDFEEKDMGPARIILARKGRYTYSEKNFIKNTKSGVEDVNNEEKSSISALKIKTKKDKNSDKGGNHILLLESFGDSEALKYSLFNLKQNKKPMKTGIIKAGESIQTGWMGLEFRLLRFLKSARRTWTYEPIERATDKSVQSLRFRFKGKEYWMELNSSVRLFSDQAYHVLVYANRQLKMDFSLGLNEFRVGRQQGIQKAAFYESDVSVISTNEEQKNVTIAMNEPLEYRGFTFYQSSFKEDEMGRPLLSVLSVNRDPGRFWKYLGSLLIVFGIVHLFYLRNKKAFS